MVAQRADIFLCALIFLLFFVLKKSCFVTTDRISITLNSVDVYDIIKETFINSTLWNSSIQYGDLLLCVLIFFIFCVKRSCFVTADRIYITLHSFDIYDVIQKLLQATHYGIVVCSMGILPPGTYFGQGVLKHFAPR